MILGTYLLFISGSVALLKLLRRNKRYYYRTNHFVSVSGMFYRMKRNGAGLASICILSTMVLVMISSTACLYIGAGDALRGRFPRDIAVETSIDEPDIPAEIGSTVQTVLDGAGARADNLLDYRYLSFTALMDGDELRLEQAQENLIGTISRMVNVYVVPAEDYERLSGRKLTVGEGEVAVYEDGISVGDTAAIGGVSRRVSEKLDAFAGAGTNATSVTGSIYLFVPRADMRTYYEAQKAAYGKNASHYRYYYGFDLPLDRTSQATLAQSIRTGLDRAAPNARVEGAAETWDDFLGIYGGLLYLGLLLGLTFVLAAVLIMYYKQVTEGYEDNARFDILKKVGMTDGEIRKTIHSQVLTVFALPLAAAAMHVAFAFPMVEKLLRIFNLTDVRLFLTVTAATILVFAAFYVTAYLATSRAYLAIIDGSMNRMGA